MAGFGTGHTQTNCTDPISLKAHSCNCLKSDVAYVKHDYFILEFCFSGAMPFVCACQNWDFDHTEVY